jgi:Mrp family chromosome partitioning ATPase
VSQGRAGLDSLESALNLVPPEAPTALSGNSGELPPPSLLSALRKHWRLNLLLIAIFALGGYLFGAFEGRAATATASFLVQDPSNPGGSGTEDRYVRNQAKILALPSVSQATATAISSRGPQVTSSDIGRHLLIGTSPNDALITVSYTSKDPVLAQQVVNTIVLAYRDVVSGQAQVSAQQQQARLSKALQQIDQQIAATSSEVDRQSLQATRSQLQSRLAEALTTSVAGADNVVASAPAALPALTPQGSTSLYAVIGAVAGLLLGGALSYIWLLRRRPLVGSHEPGLLLSVPLLGQVSRVAGSTDGRALQAPVVWPVSEPASRAVAMALTSIVVRSRNATTVAMVGANAGSGTTAIVVNLAVQAARQGQRVSMLDGDAGTGHLSAAVRSFGDKQAPRSDETPVLAVEFDEKLVLASEIEESRLVLEGLPVHALVRKSLSAMPPPLSPPACRRLLARLGERYDLVLVDVPALGSAFSAAMVASADAVVLVVPANITSDSLQHVREQLQLVDASLVGYIFNERLGGFPRERSRRGHERWSTGTSPAATAEPTATVSP